MPRHVDRHMITVHMYGMRAGSVPFTRLEYPTTEMDFAAAAKSPYPTAGVTRESPDQLLVRCTHYTSLPDVCDSDHKPVVARLRADVPSTDHKRRRRHVGKVLAEFHDEVMASLVRSSTHYAPLIFRPPRVYPEDCVGR